MAGPTWTVVVPVKRLTVAKSRLAGLAGERRGDLALAFALDTVAVALATPSVARVVVVSDEPAARAECSALGAVVVGDEPDAGLNPALRHGATAAEPEHGVAALSADLPALTPETLDLALRLAAEHAVSYVADETGTGTTLYTARRRDDFDPAYGTGSAARHHASGATPLTAGGLERLRRDVDTPADLVEAQQLGVGPRTAVVLAAITGAGPQRVACG